MNVFTLNLGLLCSTVVVGLLVMGYTRQRSDLPGARAFFWFTGFVMLWTIAAVLAMVGGSAAWAEFWFIKVRFLAVTTVPIWFLLVMLEFTGNGRWLTPGRRLMLFVIPIITQFVIWFAPTWFLSDVEFSQRSGYYIFKGAQFGSWFWIDSIYGNAAIIVAILITLRYAMRAVYPYRQQATLIFIGMLFPFTAYLISIIRPVDYELHDLTALFFSVPLIIWSWALFRYKLLVVLPVARDIIFESMGDAVIVLDDQNRVVDINRSVEDTFGWRRGEVVGKSITRLVSADQRDILLNYATVTETQAEITVDDQVYDLRISPLVRGGGHYVGRLVVLRNITERMRLLQELDAFAHTVAHDLKNPLTTIFGYVELLGGTYEKLSDEQVLAYVKQMEIGAIKMRSIIESLLMLAKVRTMEDIPFEPLNMDEIMGEVQQRLAMRIQDTSTTLILPDEWVIGLGYAPWLEEIWANYVSNAIKYGGTPPRIEVGSLLQPDNKVRFFVKDNGEGLSPEHQDMLFKKFTRINHQTKIEGHGLGLSIVQRIVGRLGGEVGVESTVGEGSTFYFTLPAAWDEK